MVAPVGNRTVIDAVVTGRRPHPRVDRWESVTVEVRGTSPVPGYADLLTRLAAEQGGRLELAVERADAADLSVGRRVEVPATLAGPEVIRAVGPLRST